MKKKIDEMLNNKTFYVILAVALAIFAWLLVLSYTNPIQSRTMEIQIKYLNDGAPANLDLQDQTAAATRTVTVTVSGRRDTVSNLAASELQTTVDLSEITHAGTTELKVTRPTCNRLGVSVEDYYPKTVSLTYDIVSQKNLKIQLKYENTLLKKDYEFLSVTPTVTSIPVSGLSSLLDTVDHIQVNLGDSVEEGTLDSDRTAVFLGRYISVTGEDITHRFSAEQITVNIKVAKKVPLTYTVTGTPDSGYYLDRHEPSSPYALLIGPSDALSEITSISLGSVSVRDAKQDVSKTFSLPDYLPNGVTACDTAAIKVTAFVLPYQTKDFTVDVTSISTPGKDDSLYEYEIVSESNTLRIKGRQDDLDQLSLASLIPTLDLQGKGVGVYRIPLAPAGLDETRFTVVGECVFTVTIQQKQPSEEPVA